MKSWKTTLAGVGAILTAIGFAMGAQFDADPITVVNWTTTFAAIMAGVGLIMARDNNRTSEEVGAK